MPALWMLLHARSEANEIRRATAQFNSKKRKFYTCVCVLCSGLHAFRRFSMYWRAIFAAYTHRLDFIITIILFFRALLFHSVSWYLCVLHSVTEPAIGYWSDHVDVIIIAAAAVAVVDFYFSLHIELANWLNLLLGSLLYAHVVLLL